jgi:hypothetical protein
MLAYYIVSLTYDIVCLFPRRRPAVPITLGPPLMLWAYGPNILIRVRICRPRIGQAKLRLGNTVFLQFQP